MKLSRREFIIAAGATIAAGSPSRSGALERGPDLSGSPPSKALTSQRTPKNAIDRKSLIDRHRPVLHKLDSLSPLSIGNGEFAFTADITGLQTFPREYDSSMPLCTMSQWGWHTTPLPAGLDPKSLRLTPYDVRGRTVGYHTSSEGQTELFNWLRQNPHRLNLARIGLLMSRGDEAASASDISEIDQKLDLWSGIIESRFKFGSEIVFVRTAVHPGLDLLAVEIRSPLLRKGRPGR